MQKGRMQERGQQWAESQGECRQHEVRLPVSALLTDPTRILQWEKIL
jgi:hypothetical protein